jgi:hypothetical protein
MGAAGIEDVHFRCIFRKTGDVYRYFGFPSAEFQAFLEAESHGRFFLAHIRGSYTCERMAKLRAA